MKHSGIKMGFHQMAGEQLQLGEDIRSVTLRRAWERALHVLAGKVNKVTFESYIRPIKPMSYEGKEVTLGVSSPFAREWLKRYVALIQSTLEGLLGHPVEVHFGICSTEERTILGEVNRAIVAEHVSDDGAGLNGNERPKREPDKARPNRNQPPIEEIPSLPISDRYNFTSFIVGKSNRLAHAAAMAVANSPGSVYNPLFIYGGCGLGKTHLMHAIGNATRIINENARIAYIDGENFTQLYVAALRERRTDEFRLRFRSVDMWLVDDIQFIAGKEQTKEEFFHTFNALYQTGKQIVISSDRSPRELRTMDERLRSRFECGLIADINAPELETRVAILDRRCVVEGWQVPEEVISYIASAIQSNIRALEGALTKLVAYSSVMNSPYSIDLAQNVLGEYFIEKPGPGRMHKRVPLDTILRAVAEQFETTVDLLKGQRRNRDTVTARQVAMYLCRELTETPLAQIGAGIGGRDHTTIQRAIQKIEATLPNDDKLRQAVHDLRRKLEY